MDLLNTNGKNLVNELNQVISTKENISSDLLKTTQTASTLAFVYEKARNAVEFRAEHLIRQAAIERILKRRIFLNQNSHKIATLLVRELSWARYLKNEELDMHKIDAVSGIIQKYRVAQNLERNGFTDWLIGLAACEIEEKLVVNPINQILTNFISQTLLNRLELNDTDELTKSIQIYIACERSYAKNSEILIAYRLLKVLLPSWKGAIEEPSSELITNLFVKLEEIQNHLNHPIGNILRRKVLTLTPPFNLIRELVNQSIPEFIESTKSWEKLENRSEEVLEVRYRQTKDKVLRASKRSIIYIFLTKMVFGLILEFPFDLFLGKVNYLALSINAIFPPSLMFLLNSGVSLPNRKNTSLILERVREYLYKDESKMGKIQITTSVNKGKGEKLFTMFFLISSFSILLGILYLLNLLGFNPISQLIFLFFLSVVSFFAFRVRGLAKDYQFVDEEKDTLTSSILDYIFLPMIKAGQWLSVQISKINILSFIFDFIIEAPLKSFLEILEDWLHFIRIKKEEILSSS